MPPWHANQKVALYQRPEIVVVDGHLKWHEILKVPAADLKTSPNVYAVVATGLMGRQFPSTKAGAKNIGEVTIRIGSGSFVQVQNRQDLTYAGMLAGGGQGFAASPFQIIYVYFPNVTPIDLYLVGRNDADPGNSFPQFSVDQASIQIWDLTAIGAANYRNSFQASPQTVGAAPLASLSTSALTTNTRWLCYVTVEFDFLGTVNVIPGFWLTRDGTPTTYAWGTRLKYGTTATQVPHISSHHRVSQTSRLSQTYDKRRLGHWTIIDTNSVSAPNVTLWHQEFARFSLGGSVRVTRADLLCFDLDALLSELTVKKNASTTATWFGPLGNADSILEEVPFVAPITADVQVNGMQYMSPSRTPNTFLNRSGALELELDGKVINPLGKNANPRGLGVHLIHPHECLSHQRIGQGQVDGGTSCVRVYGYRDTPNLDDPAQLFATDVWVVAWMGVTNWTWPVAVLDTPGAQIDLVPGREAISTASLPALPLEPSDVQPIEELASASVFKTPARYTVSWSRFLDTRRRVQFSYAGLTAADWTTLRTFLRNLKNTGGAFKWQSPDDEAVVPYVLEAKDGGEDWSDAQAARPTEVAFVGLELVYVGP